MTTYESYIDVQKQIDVLEEKKEALRTIISQELPKDGFKDESINAYWTEKKSYKYSPKVDGLTTELKSLKKSEEEDGTAVCEVVNQLTIKVK